jgi:hypothetical protein
MFCIDGFNAPPKFGGQTLVGQCAADSSMFLGLEQTPLAHQLLENAFLLACRLA